MTSQQTSKQNTMMMTQIHFVQMLGMVTGQNSAVPLVIALIYLWKQMILLINRLATTSNYTQTKYR